MSTSVRKPIADNPEFPLPASPKISSGRLVLGCLGIVLLTIVAAVTIPWMLANRQAAARLNAAIKRVKARGEPVTTAELNEFYQAAKGRPDMTQELMAAFAICEAASKSPAAPSLPIVGQGSEPPPGGQPWAQLAEAETYLAGQQEAIATFHEFARRDGTARYPVDFTPGVGTLLPETQRTREGSRALSLQFHVHRHKGEYAEAVSCISAQIALARALEHEPTLVSQLVRIAVSGVAIAESQQLVREVEVSDDDLRRLQAALRKIESTACLKSALAGERVMSYTACLDPRQMAELNGPSKGLADEIVQHQPKRISDAAKMLELNLRIAEGADESLFKARQESLAAEDEIRTLAGSLTGRLYYMYTLLLTPAYTQAISAFSRNAAERDSADAAIAAELYRRKNGKWPGKFDDVVPEFLPAVPTDPFTNLPLVMKSAAQSCKVYSVGPDGVDNGGNLTKDQKPGTDIGFEAMIVTPPK